MLAKAKPVAAMWTTDSIASERIAYEPVSQYAAHLPASIPTPTSNDSKAADRRSLWWGWTSVMVGCSRSSLRPRFPGLRLGLQLPSQPAERLTVPGGDGLLPAVPERLA